MRIPEAPKQLEIFESSSNKIARLEQRVRDLENGIAQAQAEREQANRASEGFQAEVVHLRSQLAQKNSRESKVQKSVRQLEEENTALRSRVELLEPVNEQLSNRVAFLEHQVKYSEQVALNRVAEEIAKLNEALQNKTTLVKDLEGANKNLKSHNEQLKKNNGELKAELASFKNRQVQLDQNMAKRIQDAMNSNMPKPVATTQPKLTVSQATLNRYIKKLDCLDTTPPASCDEAIRRQSDTRFQMRQIDLELGNETLDDTERLLRLIARSKLDTEYSFLKNWLRRWNIENSAEETRIQVKDARKILNNLRLGAPYEEDLETFAARYQLQPSRKEQDESDPT